MNSKNYKAIYDLQDQVLEIVFAEPMGFYLDTVRNILSNKISAIFGRDEARDMTDIVFIAEGYSFCWKQVIEEAQNKSNFSVEELLFRIQSFPPEALFTVPVFSHKELHDYKKNIEIILSDIKQQGNNRLAKPEAKTL